MSYTTHFSFYLTRLGVPAQMAEARSAHIILYSVWQRKPGYDRLPRDWVTSIPSRDANECTPAGHDSGGIEMPHHKRAVRRPQQLPWTQRPKNDRISGFSRPLRRPVPRGSCRWRRDRALRGKGAVTNQRVRHSFYLRKSPSSIHQNWQNVDAAYRSEGVGRNFGKARRIRA